MGYLVLFFLGFWVVALIGCKQDNRTRLEKEMYDD